MSGDWSSDVCSSDLPSLTLAGCRFSSRQESAGASRVADAFLFHACRRPYPGGTPGLGRSSSARGSGLPRMSGGSAPTLPFSRPARRSLSFRPACSPSRPRRPSSPEAPMASFPPPPLRLLPAGATSCRVGFAPTGRRRLCTAHRHSRSYVEEAQRRQGRGGPPNDDANLRHEALGSAYRLVAENAESEAVAAEGALDQSFCRVINKPTRKRF